MALMIHRIQSWRSVKGMQLMKTKFLHPLGRWQKGSGLETKSSRITLRVSQTQNITAARADVINVVDHNEPLKEQVKNAEDIVREQETTISALQNDLSSLMSACGVAARELQLEVKNDLLELELVQFQENDNGGEIESTEDPLLVQERGHEKEAELSTLHDKLLVQGRGATENLIPASDTRALFDKINGPRIVSALKDACFTGPVTITAFGNLEDTAGDVLRDIYSTGIALKHIPCDGFLTETDLFEWTRNNPIPACLMLICGPAQLERLARTLYDMGGYVIVLAYPRPKRSLDWLWKSFLTVVNTKWLWETFLEGSADNKQEVLEEKCSEAGESDWFCTLCDFAGQSFENFTLHLESEDHAMKEPEPPKTPPVKSQPKKTAVYWHINSCPVPPGYPPRQVRPRIVSALKNSGYSGPLTITAVGNLEQTPDKLLQDLSFTGIALRHVHRGIQNALFEWKSCNPPPATLMLICSHQQLESLSRTLYYIHNRGYTILLAYPERPQGSDWLWKSFLSVASKDWLWHNLLEVDNKPRTGRHVLREKCCETGDWFCTVCDFAGGSFRNFITHLNSEEHAQEESGMVPRPVKKPLPLNTTPDNSSQAKKTSVLWDINSCPVPCGYYPRLVGLRIVSALENSGYSGPFTITAVGNLEHTPDKLLQELSSTGIALRHDLCDFQTDMFAWVLENPPPATLMLICDHEQLELLSRSVYEIHPRGYTILLAYPQLAHGSDSLLKNFLTVSSKEWLWETLLEDSGPVVNKRMRRQVLLQENCSETGDTFCRVCDFAGESFKSFITHLKSKEHAQEELGLVYLPLKKTPSTSTMVKSQHFRSIRHHFDFLTFVEAKTLKKNGKKMEIELVVEEEEHRISIQRKT